MPDSVNRKWLMRLFKWSVVLIAVVIVIYLGLLVGYTFIGNQPAGELLKPQIWKHLIDLIFATQWT